MQPRSVDRSPDRPVGFGGTENIGAHLVRYVLAATLLWVAFLKFQPYEAMALQPFVENSPLLSWLYGPFTVEGLGIAIAIFEIVLALLIVSRPFAPMASTIGGLGARLIFSINVTFLFTTPGVWQEGLGFPYLSPMPGQFLAKDLLFAAVSLWTAGEAFNAARIRSR
ncbi:DUF417 family protein [soil metagenome]